MPRPTKGVRCIFVYPTDPRGKKVSGIETFLKGFIRYSPEDFILCFLGINFCGKAEKTKRWLRTEYRGREFDFYPLFTERNENVRSKIPLSLRFSAALLRARMSFDDGVLLFNRIEPAIAFLKSRLPKIGFVHNDIRRQMTRGESEVLWSKFPALYYFFEKYIFPRFDHIFTDNTKALNFYRRRYPDLVDIAFIPNWVDPEIFRPPSPAERRDLRESLVREYPGWDGRRKWILFVGRLQEQKNPFKLIEVFDRHLRTDPESAQMILVGEGNLKNSLSSRLVRLGCRARVFFVPPLDQQALARIYRASDLLLLTSNYEGMPLCVLEALGSGLPVVTTDVGEVRRVVKNGFSGEVAAGTSPREIATALQMVLNSPGTYTTDNCLQSVAAYTPQRVLVPVFDKVRELHEKHRGR